MPSKRKAKPKATILQPTKIKICKYVWEGLEVKQSKQKGAGAGVFATKSLPIGTMIPIIGQFQEGEVSNKLTHGWQYHGKTGGHVNGHPSINPYKKVGNFGLSIAMMLNENTTKIHTCMFKMDHVVVAVPLKAGDELTVYYGPAYEGHRVKQGYTMEHNKHLNHSYSKFYELSFPTATKRKANILKWNQEIKKCSEIIDLT